MPRVIVLDNLSREGLDLLKSAGNIECEVRTGLKGDELRAALLEFDGAICRSGVKITGDVLQGNRRLKAIARAGVGTDNINLEAATRLGIVVMNTPGGNTLSTAEHTIALMLALSRNVHPAYQGLIEGRWDRKKYMGTQLAGKTLGIIGTGRIGRALAKRAHHLGMSILGYDAYITSVEESYITMTTLDDLLAKSDYISLHVPFDPSTGAVLGDAEFARMKQGVYLINCARGGVVDEKALLRALDNGHVAGAGIDVWEKEPTDNLDLVRHPKTICTPHIGASTKEGQDRVGDEIVKILT